MKNIILTLLALLAFSVKNSAQVTLNEEPTISRMMDAYVSNNRQPSGMPPSTTPTVQVIDGFRVQLLATTDRRKVDEVIGGFGSRYQGVYSGWIQAQPYYKVRVGGFANRAAATTFLQKIKTNYPDAYIVADRVKTTELTN